MNQTKVKPQGSVIGGSLLIAGSCIGAGMLGLPIITGASGFFPSTIMFFFACFFMTTTGLFLVEIGKWFAPQVNFISIVSRFLGPIGKYLCWILYLFLFYALLIAYIATSGHHLSSIFSLFFSLKIPTWIGSCFFVILFGAIVYLGVRWVDLSNRFLMVFKVISFLFVLFIGASLINPINLEYSNSKYTFFSLPILIISFGFHNLIPTLTHYLGGDTRRIKQSILGGVLFTLSIYIAWQIVALGILPLKGEHGVLSSYKNGIDAAGALVSVLSSPLFSITLELLAFFAILTSFLAQTATVVHFLADGLKVPSKKRENISILLLALVPTLLLAVIYPNIFYKAINFAGGICAVILFGLYPALMLYLARYNNPTYSQEGYRVSGGKALIFLIATLSIFIVFYQLTETFGLKLFPTP